MKIRPIKVSKTAGDINARVEAAINALVRGYDRLARPLGVGVRSSNYDDLTFSFEGGVGDRLRKAHYDKSLRLLWKAEQHASHTSFRDCSADELLLMQLAGDAMDKAEKAQLTRVRSDAYKELLDRTYTAKQKQAIVNILATIAHGEAYAWMVSADLLSHVKSTGGRSAMTMQVLEEAKHFVVLRELLQAFDCEIPRMNIWEYVTLENILRQHGLEKFFGMNVLVEGFALSVFGTMSAFAGLEVLRMFHLDESRHTALPHNYFHDFPMNAWQKYNPVSTTRRVLLLLPMIPLLLRLEGDFAVLGIDLFDFAGSVLRKVFHLSERVGFRLPLPEGLILRQLNNIFNRYCSLTRGRHEFRDFMAAEATIGEAELAVERSVFQLARGDRGEEDAGNTAGDRPTALHTARRARATSRSVAAAH